MQYGILNNNSYPYKACIIIIYIIIYIRYKSIHTLIVFCALVCAYFNSRINGRIVQITYIYLLYCIIYVRFDKNHI